MKLFLLGLKSRLFVFQQTNVSIPLQVHSLSQPFLVQVNIVSKKKNNDVSEIPKTQWRINYIQNTLITRRSTRTTYIGWDHPQRVRHDDDKSFMLFN